MKCGNLTSRCTITALPVVKDIRLKFCFVILVLYFTLTEAPNLLGSALLCLQRKQSKPLQQIYTRETSPKVSSQAMLEQRGENRVSKGDLPRLGEVSRSDRGADRQTDALWRGFGGGAPRQSEVFYKLKRGSTIKCCHVFCPIYNFKAQALI